MYNYWRHHQLVVDQAKEARIVIINETDSEKSAAKQARWLNQHYPGLKIIQMANVHQNNRVYIRATFITVNGQRMVVLFDVTATFLGDMNTSMRIFPAGTRVRIWPRTGSRPTRVQLVGK